MPMNVQSSVIVKLHALRANNCLYYGQTHTKPSKRNFNFFSYYPYTIIKCTKSALHAHFNGNATRTESIFNEVSLKCWIEMEIFIATDAWH